MAYPVSQDYITAVTANSKQTTLSGTITFKSGTTEDITLSDIASGSVTIDKNCLENDSLEFGGVLLGSLDIGLRTSRSRYVFYGATISLTYSLLTGYTTPEDEDEDPEEIWEDVPLGIYTVSDAETTDNVVSLTAYDNLKKLDVKFGVTAISGTAFEILQEIGENTGLTLGFTAEDIAEWVNADFLFQVSADSGCSTYRDAVKIVCQTLGAFAYASRDGKLMIRQFNESSVRTIDITDRYNVVIADYQCYYSSLQLTGVRGTFLTRGTGRTDGINMIIEDAPAWDYGAKEDLQRRCDALYNYLATITYTPIEMTMPNDPSFDCGDRITIVTSKGNVETIVTNYSWSFASQMTINSVGTNPFLSDVSDANAQSSRIDRQKTQFAEMVIYEFTNTSDVILGSEFTEVATCRFITTTDTFVIFGATIQLNSTIARVTRALTSPLSISVKDENGNAKEIYDYNGDQLFFTYDSTEVDGTANVDIAYSIGDHYLTDIQTEKVFDGKHLISVIYPIASLEANNIYIWKVHMRTDNGTILIPRSTMKAVIFGSGLLKPDAWNGYITVDDTYQFVFGEGIEFDYEEHAVTVNNDIAIDPDETVSDTYAFGIGSDGIGFGYGDTLQPITFRHPVFLLSTENDSGTISTEDNKYLGTD